MSESDKPTADFVLLKQRCATAGLASVAIAVPVEESSRYKDHLASGRANVNNVQIGTYLPEDITKFLNLSYWEAILCYGGGSFQDLIRNGMRKPDSVDRIAIA